MKYRAYLLIEDKKIQVFPRSKKTSFFQSKEEAAKVLESKTRNMNFNSFGQVWDTEGKLALTMAL